MVPKGGLEPPRVTSHAPQTCASTSSATSAFRSRTAFGLLQSYQLLDRLSYFVAGDEAGACGLAAGAAVGAVAGAVVVVVPAGAPEGAVAGEGCCCGLGDAAGCASSVADCNTERWPRMGSESIRAISMKSAAAPMVILARSVCVPRGPNAVLDTLLEKSAPASALPGCNSTATTSTMQVKIKRPYKT
jgi:hypothetical protein